MSDPTPNLDELARLREYESRHCEPAITTRCPACGGQSLFIAVGGHLTCSWLKCPEPGPAAAFKAERQQREQTERQEARLRAALERLEWDDGRYGTPCPACQCDQQDGHADGCWLDAALAEEGQDG